jgi:DNA-binding HxlR family transcriptional regulator
MHFGYPLQATSNVLAGKWKVLIVWRLGFGSKRAKHSSSTLDVETAFLFPRLDSAEAR